jgi:hypothetical protein
LYKLNLTFADPNTTLSSVLEVLKKNVQSFALRTVVLDDNARAAHNLAGVAFSIDLAQSGPCTKDLRVSDLDQVDVVLGAQRDDELDVLGLSASLNKDAKMRLALVECLGSLSKTASKSIVEKSVLQDLLHNRVV